MLDENEEYEFSEGSENILRMHYPNTLTPNHPLFMQRMKETQIRLIQHHMYTMTPEDKRRAQRTLKELQA
jgi:hypothetical protein